MLRRAPRDTLTAGGGHGPKPHRPEGGVVKWIRPQSRQRRSNPVRRARTHSAATSRNATGLTGAARSCGNRPTFCLPRFREKMNKAPLVLLTLALVMSGCGGSGGGDGIGGMGGMAGVGGNGGSGGTAGVGGSAGAGGQSGAGGIAGAGGQSGAGGSAGAAGQSGVGGSAGAAGQGGAGGSAGAGGQGGAGGMAGAGAQGGAGGQGGASGSGGTAGTGGMPENRCPFYTSVLVSPLSQSVGNLIDVDTRVLDLDGDAVDVLVTSDCGEVADPLQTADADRVRAARPSDAIARRLAP